MTADLRRANDTPDKTSPAARSDDGAGDVSKETLSWANLESGQSDWGTSWEVAPQIVSVAPLIRLPLNIQGAAWIETKWNKEKTLGYRVMRWRDKDAKTEKGNFKKRMLYIRRLGGQYIRTPRKKRKNVIDRTALESEYVVRNDNFRDEQPESERERQNAPDNATIGGANAPDNTTIGGANAPNNDNVTIRGANAPNNDNVTIRGAKTANQTESQ